MNVGFLSDVHIENNSISLNHALNSINKIAIETKLDKLFLCGDTSNNTELTLEIVEKLNNNGLETYTVFGNHEYWSKSYQDIQLIDNDKYIHGKTVVLNDKTVVVGIDGFFDFSFFTEVNNQFTKNLSKDKAELINHGKSFFDLTRLANQPDDYDLIFDDMLAKLESQLEANYGKQIIVIMHHVPHSKFVIYNDDEIWTKNNAFMGSEKFHELFVKYKVDKVFFGHTHNTFNDIINNIEYHCNAIGYQMYEFTGTLSDRINNKIKILEV